VPLHDINCGYKAYRCKVVKRLNVYGEMHRLIPVFARKFSYRIGEIPVAHHPRLHGASNYGLERFYRGAADVLTAWFLTRYAQTPGHFFTKIGLVQGTVGMIFVCGGVAAGAATRGWGVPVVLLAGGILLWALATTTVAAGLLSEQLLRSAFHIDPAVYVEEESSQRCDT